MDSKILGMLQKLHKNAKTDYHIREYIKTNNESISELARELNVEYLMEHFNQQLTKMSTTYR